MAQYIDMPSEEAVPQGPRRDLLLALHQLYRDAGHPSLRRTSEAIRQDDGAHGAPTHEGVAGLLRGSFTQAPPWQNLQSLVRTLATWSHRHPSVEEEESRFHDLWLKAELAQTREAQDHPWVDDIDAYHQALPYGLAKAQRSLSLDDLIGRHDRGEYEHLPALVTVLLWPSDARDEIAHNAITTVQMLRRENKPLLARAVLNAGVLGEHHDRLVRFLEQQGLDEDAAYCRELARRHLPAFFV